ncbi:protein eiger [Agrilus planipennis]|uniref:Protein eiger n=1 Tax=Agrilus planipennis TaxID=224129 RepID=A0A7F5RNA7_AGRPL|nr:protein eiger [Agrilus planipennis]
MVYDSNYLSESENDNYASDYLENDVSSDNNFSDNVEMTRGNPNASQIAISLVKRAVGDANAQGLSLASDDSKEILSDNLQPTESFTRRTRARNPWRPNVDVEEIEPKSTATSRRRNRNRHRNNNLESLQQAIVHFSGDTSKYVVGKHENFRGNGHLRHPNQIFADWKESDWVKPLGMNEKFDFMNGYLKIKENGLYFVYAQIYYLDEHDTNGFHVHKNRDAILQCTVMTHTVSTVTKGNTCYTAGVEYLREGDEISIRDVGSHRYSLFEPGKSFFGVIKLGDVKVK